MEPERKTIVKGCLVEEFYWNGKLVVNVDHQAVDNMSFEEASEAIRQDHAWRKGK